MTYVPDAVPEGDGTREPRAARRRRPGGAPDAGGALGAQQVAAPTTVTLFDQGLVQVLEAAVTGLAPKQPYVLALSRSRMAAARCSRCRPSRPTRRGRRSSTPSDRSARSSRAMSPRRSSISSCCRERRTSPVRRPKCRSRADRGRVIRGRLSLTKAGLSRSPTAR